TSIPSLTRSGRPFFSFSSSAPWGSTSTAFRVSSATPISPLTLTLESRSSVPATTLFQVAAPAPPPDPKAPPLLAAAPAGSAELRVLQCRSRHGDRERDPDARPEPDQKPAGRLHLRRRRKARSLGPARVAEPDH